MTNVPSLRAHFMVREIDASGLLDVPARDLLADVGIDPALLDDASALLPLQPIADIYERAGARAGDDAFGLHVGENARPVLRDVFDYAVMSRPTIAAAFEELKPLLFVLYPEAEIKLVVREGTAGFSYRMAPKEARAQRHRCEALVTTVKKIAESALGRTEPPPICVSFQHPAPRDTSEHARIFRAPVRFDCPASEILFEAEVLDAPVATADPNLSAVLDRHARDLLARLPKSARFGDHVRRSLVAAFARRGPPTLAGLARTMGVSERTLQRRLGEEGTTVQLLTEDVRHELSLEYLRDRSLSVGEVADRLGYSSLAAFSRAFRRWRGVSPAAHRRGTGSITRRDAAR
jgi:AraC-like DNA-binding protein